MVIDPRQLARSAATKSVIEYDRACAKCSYNLRGLPRSAVCPECGTPIDPDLAVAALDPSARRKPKRKSGPRSVMDFSWSELGRLSNAATMVSWGMLTVALAMGVQWFRWLFLSHQWEDRGGNAAALLFAFAAAGAAFASLGALIIVTVPRDSGRVEHGHRPKATYAEFLRTVPRWIKIAAPALLPALALGFLAGMLSALNDAGTTIASVAQGASVVLIIVGFVGLGILSVIIHSLAYIIGDDLALNRGMIGGAGIPICGVVLAFSPVWGPLGGFDAIIAPGTILVFSAIVSILPIMWLAGVLSFGRSCRWTQRNVLIQEDKQARAIERAARESERINRQLGAPPV